MSIEFKPHAYQIKAVKHLLTHPRCSLWTYMGGGKTVCTLTAWDLLRQVGEVMGPLLVIAPLRPATTTWPTEVKKWQHLSHLKITAVHGSPAQRIAALKKNSDIYTINYENIPWLVEHYKEAWPFETVVADESTKLKSFRLRQGGKRAAALAKVAHPKVKRWINLTGTPAPNGLIDLWGQTYFIDRGQRLGYTFTAFKDRWFKHSYDGFSLEPLPYTQEQIEERLKDVCFSIDPRDYITIKEPIKINVEMELPPPAMAAYKEMQNKMFLDLKEEGEIIAFNAASKTTKCLQLANGAIYTNPETKDWAELHTVKLEALSDIIDSANGAPVLVAYNFISDRERLVKYFPQGKVMDQNPKTIEDWNAGKIPLLFLHPKSAGHGLNLQDGGNILVFFSIDWNLEEHQQVIERIGPLRQAQAGHDRPVFIYYILAKDTLDSVVLKRLENKGSIQQLLLEAMNND